MAQKKSLGNRVLIYLSGKKTSVHFTLHNSGSVKSTDHASTSSPKSHFFFFFFLVIPLGVIFRVSKIIYHFVGLLHSLSASWLSYLCNISPHGKAQLLKF